MLSLLFLLGGQEALTPPPAQLRPPAELRPSVEEVRRPLTGNSVEGSAAGHTGDVVLEATAAADGSLTDIEVVQTARSEILDGAAIDVLGAARLREPRAGQRLRFTVGFSPAAFPRTRCEDVRREMAWYQQAWPERDRSDVPIYELSHGFFALLVLTGEVGEGAAAFHAFRSGFDAAFDEVVAACEATPDAIFLEAVRVRLGFPPLPTE